jgi:hypothetical protein
MVIFNSFFPGGKTPQTYLGSLRASLHMNLDLFSLGGQTPNPPHTKASGPWTCSGGSGGLDPQDGSQAFYEAYEDIRKSERTVWEVTPRKAGFSSQRAE